MKLSKLKQSVAVIALLTLSGCDNQSKSENQLRVDQVFAEFTSETPGCAVAIDRSGEIQYQVAYGIGDFEQNIPLSSTSVFYAASVSKQVVAMAALLLEQDGLIDLDADIHIYIPEFKDYGKPMTVRNILHHTSGIRDYFNLFELAGTLDGMVITEDKIMTMLARQQNLNFDPGDQWAYSNSAYFLISQIVKRVADRTLDDYAQQRIFTPLGMTSTRFQHNHLRPIENKAHGHSLQDNGEWFIADSLLDVVGSGGMYTNVIDLIKWDRNFYDNILGTGQDMIDEMQTSATLNNGDKTDYGLALDLKPYRGLKRASHGGTLVGYRAMLQRFPDQQFSVALLCNNGTVNSQQLANAVSDIYLEEAFIEPAPAAQQTDSNDSPYQLDDGVTLVGYTGNYYNDEVENSLIVSEEENGIFIDDFFNEPVMAPVRADVFASQSGNMELVFDRDTDGNISGMTYNGTRVMRVRFIRQ